MEPIKDEFSDRPMELMKEVLPLDRIEDFLKDHTKMLDIGCGTGNMMKYFQSLGFDVVGLTYQEEEVEEANKRELEVVYGDAHDLPFDSDNFDSFLMIDVLEHTLSPLTVLSEAKRILKTSGRGVIYIPSERWISCSYHIIVPNLKQMLHLFKLADINVLDVVRTTQDSYVYFVEKE